MKIRSILKPFGELDTKLKDKGIKFLKLVLILITVYMFFLGLFFTVDDLFNGMLAEWFVKSFIESYYIKGGITVEKLNWVSLRHFIFISASIVIAIWTVSIFFTVLICRKRAESDVIRKTGKYVKDYMESEKNADDIFPEGYADLAFQMAELKSRMRSNEQLIRDEATRKNDLIAYLAHDLKTPLTSIIGYMTLLEEAPEMPAEQKAKYVSISLKKAIRLESLINEFFEITRYNLNELALEKETFDLSYMLMQLTDEFYPILKENNNTVRLDAESGLKIYADPDRLARVFNNILKNAVAYSYSGTEITVTAKKENNKITVAFANRGKTIPAQKLQSIFEKFFRLDEARATNTGGAGLGLAIAQEIVELHGGTITAQSENEITVFTVTLIQPSQNLNK